MTRTTFPEVGYGTTIQVDVDRGKVFGSEVSRHRTEPPDLDPTTTTTVVVPFLPFPFGPQKCTELVFRVVVTTSDDTLTPYSFDVQGSIEGYDEGDSHWSGVSDLLTRRVTV